MLADAAQGGRMRRRMKEGAQNSSNQQGRWMQTRQDWVKATGWGAGALLIRMLVQWPNQTMQRETSPRRMQGPENGCGLEWASVGWTPEGAQRGHLEEEALGWLFWV